MQLRHLEAFVAVAEAQSFSRAAEHLGTAQSVVSRSVGALELEWGLLLFERGRHRVELTEAGAAILSHARRVLDATLETQLAARRLARGLQGRLRIGLKQAVMADASLDVPALLADFHHRFPEVELLTSHAGSLTNAKLLAKGQLDLAFVCLSPAQRSGLSVHALGGEDMQVVCATSHRLASVSDVALSELGFYSFAELPLDWGIRALNDDTLRAAGVDRDISIEANDVVTLLQIVRRGPAIALLPPSVTASVPGLSTVPIRAGAPRFETHLAWATDRALGPAAQELRRMVRERLIPASPADGGHR